MKEPGANSGDTIPNSPPVSAIEYGVPGTRPERGTRESSFAVLRPYRAYKTFINPNRGRCPRLFYLAPSGRRQTGAKAPHSKVTPE